MATANILKSLINNDSLKEISKLTGVDAGDVSNVLVNALPDMLKGATKQTTSKSSSSFVTALAQHALSNTDNLGSFFKKVDLDDGAKIVGHLIGSSDTLTSKVSKKTGVDTKTVMNILAAAAPLFMSLLGKQTKADAKNADEGKTLDLANQLLGNIDASGLAGSLLGTNKKADNKIDAKDVVNLIGKFIK